ncbi:MAG: hypothetical protein ACXW32_02440 [Limisphaerales bacterium]
MKGSKVLALVLVVIVASVRLGAAEVGFNLTFKGGTPQELVQEMPKTVAAHSTAPEKGGSNREWSVELVEPSAQEVGMRIARS